MGFQVKFGKNIYKNTYKYTASIEERVDDLNEMIYDKNVKMIFFGGGYGSVDLLPYIDYNRIKETPKLDTIQMIFRYCCLKYLYRAECTTFAAIFSSFKRMVSICSFLIFSARRQPPEPVE